MPELPEVETAKRFLAKKIIGKRIKQIEVLSDKQLIGNPKLVIGKKIIALDRRAKILIINLEKDIFLLIHLKLTGQLVYVKNLKNSKAVFGHPVPLSGGNVLPGKSTRIIIYLDQGVVFFNDLRKFGWMKIIKSEKLKIKSLGKLGVEPLSAKFTAKLLAEILSRSRRAVKLVLMDQSKIAGIGNIYANDALWEAGIDPRKPANQVKRVKGLRAGIRKVLKDGIILHGASAADQAYIKPDAQPREYQEKTRVYQRDGQPCHKCKFKIRRIKIANRGTFFCPKCQK